MKIFTGYIPYIILSLIISTLSNSAHAQKDSLIKKYHNDDKSDTVKGAGYYFDAGTAKAQGGDCVAAIELYDKCISLDPITYDAYYNRAYCKMHLNDYEAAIADFTTCMRLHNGPYSNALYLRGSCFSQLKRYDMAIGDFTKALEVSSNPDIYAARGFAYMQKQDFQRSVSDYNTAIGKNPEKIEFYGQLALSLYGIRHLKEAIADADKYLDQNPSSPELVEMELRAKYEMKDYAGALVSAQQFIKLQNKPISYYYAGLMAFNMAKYEDATKYFSTAISLDANYRDAYYSRALCYFGVNDNAHGCLDIMKAKSLGFQNIDPKIESYCNGLKGK